VATTTGRTTQRLLKSSSLLFDSVVFFLPRLGTSSFPRRKGKEVKFHVGVKLREKKINDEISLEFMVVGYGHTSREAYGRLWQKIIRA